MCGLFERPTEKKKRGPTSQNTLLQCYYYIQMLLAPRPPPKLGFLYIAAISTQASPPHSRSVEFAAFIDPKDRAGDASQQDQVPRSQSFGLEDALQEGEVNDGHLAQKAAADGEVEHAVAHDLQLPAQHAFPLAAARQGVEHVEKHKAGECHRGIPGGHSAVCGHLTDVDDDSAKHDDRCRGQDALDQCAGEHSSVLRSRRAGHDCGIDRLDAQRLRGWPVHENICRQVVNEVP